MNYSSVNEDWRTEADALRLGPGDRVLCVTGSGARPLDLLAVSPAHIVAIDVNPAQTAVLELKVAALRRFPFEEYVRFLGFRPADARWRRDRLRELQGDLPPASRQFWNARKADVAAGILYRGRWERFYRRTSAVARFLRPGFVPRLFAFDDLDAQRRFVAREWTRPVWRRLLAVVGSPRLHRLLHRDPAFYAGVSSASASYLDNRMRGSLDRYLARANFMMSLVLRGELSEEDPPPHLTRDGAERIRVRLDGLQTDTGDAVEFLAARPAGSFTRFSLSDLPSYLDARRFGRLLDEIHRSGAPGARYCIRQFLVRHPWPVEHRLTRQPDLERQLAREDRSFAYDFLIGEVPGG